MNIPIVDDARGYAAYACFVCTRPHLCTSRSFHGVSRRYAVQNSGLPYRPMRSWQRNLTAGRELCDRVGKELVIPLNI